MGMARADVDDTRHRYGAATEQGGGESGEVCDLGALCGTRTGLAAAGGDGRGGVRGGEGERREGGGENGEGRDEREERGEVREVREKTVGFDMVEGGVGEGEEVRGEGG